MAGERPRLLRHLLRVALAASRARIGAALSRSAPPFPGGRPLRVALLSAYPPAHWGTAFRISRWIPFLEARDCRVDLLCPSTEEEFAGYERGGPAEVYRYHAAVLRNRTRDLRRAAAADVVWMHRGLLPFDPFQRPTFERVLARRNPRLVYDLYDPLWVLKRRIHDGARSRLARWLNPPDLVESIMERAAAVTVSNEHLAGFARERHGDVTMLPMLLDPGAEPVREHREASPLVVGWVGSRGNLPRIRGLAGALRRAAARVPLRVRIVSFEEVAIPGVEVTSLTHPWSEESEREDLAAIDVGLLPMADDPVDRGKSPMKLLQYSAAGVPTIASPVAIDPEVWRDGESILYARDEDGWVRAIERLAGDPALRASLARRAREIVLSRYSFAAWADRLHALLLRVARSPYPAAEEGS